MSYSILSDEITKHPSLCEYKYFYLILLDKASLGTAFLVDAVKVIDSCVSPLLYDYDPAPEYGEAIYLEKREINGKFETILTEKLTDDDHDIDFVSVEKTLRPEVTIRDDKSNVVSYHLNRTKDGIVGLADDNAHDLPIIYLNVGCETIKIEGKKYKKDDCLIQTSTDPSRAKRKRDVANAWDALLNSPEIAKEVEKLRAREIEKHQKQILTDKQQPLE